MSTSNILRRSPRKNPRQPPLVVELEAQNAQANWKPAHERVLLDILMDLVKAGVKGSFGQHLGPITKDLNNHICDGTIYRKEQVKRKITYLKTMYKEYTDLINGAVTTGSGWDTERNTIALTAEQWIQLRDVSIFANNLGYTCDVTISYAYEMYCCFIGLWIRQVLQIPWWAACTLRRLGLHIQGDTCHRATTVR
jgi:hypothetical protein